MQVMKACLIIDLDGMLPRDGQVPVSLGGWMMQLLNVLFRVRTDRI